MDLFPVKSPSFAPPPPPSLEGRSVCLFLVVAWKPYLTKSSPRHYPQRGSERRHPRCPACPVKGWGEQPCVTNPPCCPSAPAPALPSAAARPPAWPQTHALEDQGAGLATPREWFESPAPWLVAAPALLDAGFPAVAAFAYGELAQRLG